MSVLNDSLPVASVSDAVFAPEQSPFKVLFVDVTHRCNMECRNCYIPNRDVPDMDVQWMLGVLGRLPQRTRIRIAGAEPTVRTDLPDIISQVRQLGHTPTLLTNGLKMGNRAYVRRLKQAGLRTVYLSLNGLFDDDIYENIDNLRCAARKRQALEALCSEHMNVTLGMILVRGVNEHLVRDLVEYAATRPNIRELHFRSVGKVGRYMATEPFGIAELADVYAAAIGLRGGRLKAEQQSPCTIDMAYGRLNIQMTQWPELGSLTRGRLRPDGMVQPMFEHIVANSEHY